MDTLCACDLHVTTRSTLYQLTSCTSSKGTINMSTVIQHVACNLSSSCSFNFRPQILKSMRTVVVHMITEVAPKEIITEI